MIKTPRPNLGAGMQSFLSGYAIWSARRWRRTGHLFQGRYRTEMIEDDSHYWTVSRYIHLNPVRAGLVPRPEGWQWSSYPGYRDKRIAQDWVAHDALLGAWKGDHGGQDARREYVRFVERGLDNPPPPPFREAYRGWVLGSEQFLDRLRNHASTSQSNPPLTEARQISGLDPKRILAAVSAFYGLDDDALSRRHDPHVARAVAAWLCRRHTEASLRELAGWLGLSRADSVPNLTRRIEERLKTSRELSSDLAEILKRASKPTPAINPVAAKRTQAPRKPTSSKTKING
jgi:alkanesulfonate monooxygenase SsuD/methylene tetrahydromethanopterin reductase-like flavin-dependent oxidoreductase (luciferase family)